MNKHPTYWAIVPAAGIGQRMQTSTPKQYLRLGTRKVIEHALTPIIQHPLINKTYIALNKTDTHWVHTEYAKHPSIIQVTGGTERSESVLNALHALAKHADDDDWVLVHDAARPYLQRTDLDRLIHQVSTHPTAAGGLLGSPVRDTLKRAGRTGEIIHTQDRTQLWQAYTPQMCRFSRLYQNLQSAYAAGVAVTDEASAMERAGEIMLMVQGRADNIKITCPEDMQPLSTQNQDRNLHLSTIHSF